MISHSLVLAAKGVLMKIKILKLALKSHIY